MNNSHTRQRFSPAEVQTIKRLYRKQSIRLLSSRLGRSPRSVYCKMSRLGLRLFRHFSPDEVRLIRDEYSTKGAKALAEALGRDEASIRHKARRLGVTNGS